MISRGSRARRPRYFLSGSRPLCYDAGVLVRRLAFLVVLIALVAGCASNPPRPVRSEFEDIPVPKGLTYQPGQSTIIESPNVKAARLVYRGRMEPESLALAMRTTLEANGWRNVSSTTTATHGATQVYEKGGNSLQIQIWEGFLNWFTYVELIASRTVK